MLDLMDNRKPFPGKWRPCRLVCNACLLLLLPSCSTAPADSPEVTSKSGGASGEGGGSGGSSEDGSPSTGGSSTSGAGGEGGEGGSGGEIFAHVRAVAITGSELSYTFDVTVESSDIDCTQFANWWEIISETGELLYRRILNHSHTDENGSSDADAPGNTFTRNGGPVEVDADQLVYVRAHMNTGGYNGDVFFGTAKGGFELIDDLPSDFATDVEFAAPQSERCDF
jgi:hypothetical protein